MNRPPEILVNSGFVTDENGVLTEMVIPNNVVTQNMPSIVTTYATTINWIPSNSATLQELNAFGVLSLPQIYSSNSGMFRSFTNLQKINFPSLVSIGAIAQNCSYAGHFFGCNRLTTIMMPQLATIAANGSGGTTGTFSGCTSLVDINLPSITSIGGSPNNTGGHFYGCTSLQNVQLGSEGHAVSSLGNYIFTNCTQSGLTITIYTQGGAALSGEPWGATNAVIEYEEA